MLAHQTVTNTTKRKKEFIKGRYVWPSNGGEETVSIGDGWVKGSFNAEGGNSPIGNTHRNPHLAALLNPVASEAS
jgi:hypothetical protein